ncbi:MAG TPA: DUF192 domain-containing protein [Thermoanaerobaculia bacterium]
MKTATAVLAAVTGMLGCGAASKASGPAPSTTPAAASTPASASTSARTSGPRVRMPSGAEYSLELALTPEDQAQGLMFRESLPERHGMLFVFTETAPHHFWMKNTMIPLDMIWLDASGKVLFVSADTPPCKTDPCPTYGPDGPAQSVLEIAGGKAKAEGAAAGTKLELIDVKP